MQEPRFRCFGGSDSWVANSAYLYLISDNRLQTLELFHCCHSCCTSENVTLERVKKGQEQRAADLRDEYHKGQ